jgi:DNA-binding MarR family transcriptional regulator
LLDEGNVEEYTEQSLFGGKIDSLKAHVARKQALADPFRYSVLHLVYEYGRVSRKLLARETGRDGNDLQHHLRELLKTNLIGEVPAPEGADGRQTFYRITTLGRQEIASDIEHVRGGRQHERRFERFGDTAFDDSVDGVERVPADRLVQIDSAELNGHRKNVHSRREAVSRAGSEASQPREES